MNKYMFRVHCPTCPKLIGFTEKVEIYRIYCVECVARILHSKG